MKTVLLVFAFCYASICSAAPTSNQKVDEHVLTFLVKHCQECHQGEKPKGAFKVDGLSADFDSSANRERWLAALNRVQTGDMPPKAKPRPSEKDVQSLAGWIETQSKASRLSYGRTVLRRLNRVEYQNTVRDLLGIDVDLEAKLPADSAANGFDNSGEALHVSSFLLEKYLEAADTALTLAIANEPQPPVIKKKYSLKNQHHVKTSTESVYRIEGDVVTMFSSSAWNAVHVYEFYPPDRGRYRFRISASAMQSADKPVTYCVSIGGKQMAGKSGLVDYFDAPAGKSSIAEFVEFMEPRTTITILPYGLANAQTVNKIGAYKYEGQGLTVQFVEIEGPLHESWPPESHRRIFGDREQKPSPVSTPTGRRSSVSRATASTTDSSPSPIQRARGRRR